MRLSRDDLDRVLIDGPQALLSGHGIGVAADVERTESEGCLAGANPAAVSERARLRGADQLGTLGSGNHFLEVQRVATVIDASTAESFGLHRDQVTVLIHSGSRGFGHQVCTDHVRLMDRALRRYDIVLPDRQLACAPLSSPEGRGYLAAMAAAANFAFANRATLAHRVRQSIARTLGPPAARDTLQVYDVAHNVAKLERHHGRTLCVHRKGATRAFPAGSADIPAAYRQVGQPVFIPGSMVTSTLLAVRPRAMELTSGRPAMAPGADEPTAPARDHRRRARRELEAQGIVGAARPTAAFRGGPVRDNDVERVVAVVERWD